MKRSTQKSHLLLKQALRVISFISVIGIISSGAGADTGEDATSAQSDLNPPSSFIQMSWFNSEEAPKSKKSAEASLEASDSDAGAAISGMASSLRRLGREKASAKHLPLFEESIRLMTDDLDEHAQNWSQTDRTELARLAEHLRKEGQKRLADRRVNYAWAHQFVLRSVLLFGKEAAKSTSLRKLIGDATRFDRAVARGLVNEPSLQAFQKQLNDVRILIAEFPHIVVEPTANLVMQEQNRSVASGGH